MRYISTRGRAPELGFDEVLLAGLASDQGLYWPKSWPEFSPEFLAALRTRYFAEAVAVIVGPFMQGSILSPQDIEALCRQAYRNFRHEATAPIRQLSDRLFLLELFHGPTLAFKDFALQLLGELFEAVLSRKGERLTIAGATSGDTGSAAIEALKGKKAVDLFMLYPRGRISEVQRRQMTTVHADNVYAIAIEGSFDDCQALVKACFADDPFRKEVRLSAVNSINWARIMGQLAYYLIAGSRLGAPERSLAISVPSGNFGNLLSAWVAKRLGMNFSLLGVASNRNDALTRFFLHNDMSLRPVSPSLSPSMDIQISSNFERLLFELLERDSHRLSTAMRGFTERGKLELADEVHAGTRQDFRAASFSDAETLDLIRRFYDSSGEALDPHSAIGVGLGEKLAEEAGPTLAVATAHPAKFPETQRNALGMEVKLPSHLGDLYKRKERLYCLESNLEFLKSFILEKITR